MSEFDPSEKRDWNVVYWEKIFEGKMEQQDEEESGVRVPPFVRFQGQEESDSQD